MAKARVSTNPMYTGGAGGYSFYVRGGEQVVRQRRNNSNYGETASRSEAQMIRRVRWANLVNMYKACKFWMPKAFETKSKGQTDYNLFMSMNINEARVALTKDMAQNGCAANAGQYVSRGSIAPIALYEYDTGVGAELEIALTVSPGASLTVGAFAANIIANNPVFREGDNIAVVLFVNTQDGRNYPYLQSIYSEITLDSSNTQLLQSINLMNRISKSTGNRLMFACGASNSHESGIAFIHTRKVGGDLQVSTQRVFQTGENINGEYSDDIWTQACIDSYGLDVEVPLDPGYQGGGSSSALPSYASYIMVGSDAALVQTPSFQVQPGRYRVYAVPSVWDVDSVAPENAVISVNSYDQSDTLHQLLIIKQSDFDGVGLPVDTFIDVPSDSTKMYMTLRADSGQSIQLSIRKV